MVFGDSVEDEFNALLALLMDSEDKWEKYLKSIDSVGDRTFQLSSDPVATCNFDLTSEGSRRLQQSNTRLSVKKCP